MAAHRHWIHLQRQLVPQIKETTSLDARYTKNALRRQRETIEAAIRRGYLKQLNKELVLDSQLRTEGCAAASELEYVQRISLGRCHIQSIDDFDLLSCVRLRICNLESCYLEDIGAFYGCNSLLKLDLTDNQVEKKSQVSRSMVSYGSPFGWIQRNYSLPMLHWLVW